LLNFPRFGSGARPGAPEQDPWVISRRSPQHVVFTILVPVSERALDVIGITEYEEKAKIGKLAT
jgi:hypothetical protein